MDGFMIYIVEKGLIKGFELGMEMCLQTTATDGMDIRISGKRWTGNQALGWQRQKVTNAAQTPPSPGSASHTQIP